MMDTRLFSHFPQKRMNSSKKGEVIEPASGASVFIFLFTLILILYILFIPPDDRAELLGEGGSSPSVETPGNPFGPGGSVGGVDGNLPPGVLLLETPGSIDYNNLNELEIPLNSFTLYSTVNAQVIEEFNPFYVKTSIADKVVKNLTFEVPELTDTDNVFLSFQSKLHKGVLTIRLNGVVIYEFTLDESEPKPVKIKRSLLQEQNVLEFSVSSVGVKFWSTNEYSIEGAKIIGDVLDRSRQDSQNTFFMDEEKAIGTERALMKFQPECIPSNVGKLSIYLNGRMIFSGIPDCGNPNFVEFAPNLVVPGRNRVDFHTTAGSYLIDLIRLRLEFTDNEIPVYYFDIDDFFFLRTIDSPNAECGRIDGICPDFCGEDTDYDCCMSQYTTPYWCVARTANEDDRCVGVVVDDNKDRCSTNYMDRSDDVSDVGEGLCGDNNDNECPAGCSADRDKDCCYDQDGDQYWCEYLPTNGLSFRCMDSVSLGQCDICPTGYDSEGERPICSPSQQGFEVDQLKPDYGVILSMKFVDDFSRKEADIYINGHLTRLQTNGAVYQRDISHLVEPGTNAIELVPFSVLDVREMQIEILR